MLKIDRSDYGEALFVINNVFGKYLYSVACFSTRKIGVDIQQPCCQECPARLRDLKAKQLRNESKLARFLRNLSLQAFKGCI